MSYTQSEHVDRQEGLDWAVGEVEVAQGTEEKAVQHQNEKDHELFYA